MNKSKAIRTQNLLCDKDVEIHRLRQLLEKTEESHQLEIKKLRNYYENILALMPGHVYWLDRHNVYLGCNDIQAKQAQLNSRQDIVGKRNIDLPWKEQAFHLDKLNLEIMATGKSRTEIEHASMANGDGVYLSQKVPLFDEMGSIIGLLGISIDITELKRTEVALVVAKELAEAANKAKIEFIANMSHDIRTPLSGLVGMSKHLELNLMDSEHKQYAQWINESGEQLLRLLNDILDVISVENMNENDLREDTFDLYNVVDDIIKLERPTTELKNIQLNMTFDHNIPPLIVSDRAKLHRILLNLLSNAIKFTEMGYVNVTVNLVEQDHQHITVQFKIIDSGIGIPPEHQDKVFDRFYRANSSYDGVYAGHGVGLHIAQTYVKLLGSTLNLTSIPNVGTTFYFDLQVKIGLNKDQQKQAHEVAKTKQLYPAIQRLPNEEPYLLLVEDNIIALTMAELIATQAGCRFMSIMNGEEALELVKSTHFDLIITDVGLPGLSGYEFTRRVRDWEASLNKINVPIIGLTAHAKHHAKNKCFQSGMSDVLCKPLTIETMLLTLERFLVAKTPETQAPIDSLLTETNSPCHTAVAMGDITQFPLFDLEHAKQRLGNEMLLFDMLNIMFNDEMPNHIITLNEAYARHDWKRIQKIAHKIKGGAVYCGTYKMQYACQHLEHALETQQVVYYEELFQQLLTVLQETKTMVMNLGVI